MKRTPAQLLAIAAGIVIIALTVAAFWLSYAHLAEVALAHGLGAAPERAWAWPATLDLFIVAGELLMLRAALSHTVDPWAIGLTVVGSVGSIALNVAGVGQGAGALSYVVAAVPPAAALLAFGALMRQVHQALSHAAVAAEDRTPGPVVDLTRTMPARAVVEPSGVRIDDRPALEPVKAAPQVICGAGQVLELAAPTPQVRNAPEDRLRPEQAAAVIRNGWVSHTSVTETARLSTRSESYVRRQYKAWDATAPADGQTAIAMEAVTA